MDINYIEVWLIIFSVVLVATAVHLIEIENKLASRVSDIERDLESLMEEIKDMKDLY